MRSTAVVVVVVLVLAALLSSTGDYILISALLSHLYLDLYMRPITPIITDDAAVCAYDRSYAGYALKASVPADSPLEQPAARDQWPCNPLGAWSTLDECQDFCRKLDATVGTYHNDLCCCIVVAD
jgi:hypothetical protein